MSAIFRNFAARGEREAQLVKDLTALGLVKAPITIAEYSVERVEDWIADALRPGGLVNRTLAYAAYKNWCAELGDRAIGSKSFYQLMERLGYRLVRRADGRYIEGVSFDD